jgi:hypothetical protein
MDLFKTESGAAISKQVAAVRSTAFDAVGAVGLDLLRWMFDRFRRRRRAFVFFYLASKWTQTLETQHAPHA